MNTTNDVIAVAGPPEGVPALDIDLHANDLRENPHPWWRQLREIGPIVWLKPQQAFFLSRYAEVTEALRRSDDFISGEGLGLNEFVNSGVVKSLITTDPPDHARLRAVESKPLLPTAVRELQPRLKELADETILKLKGAGTFEGVKELASVLPVGVVAELVGLPDDDQLKLLDWASAAFNSLGRMDDELTQSGLETLAVVATPRLHSVLGELKPGSWAASLVEAEERGELNPGEASMLLLDYIYPSLDTTILSIAYGLKMFADHPDQWDLLRTDRSLLRSAVNEIVRLATPIQWFARFVKKDCQLGGVTLPAGSRVIVGYGSANRDDARFPDAEKFNITRENVSAHVAWGKGIHTCVGMQLARLELEVLFDALADHVERIETDEYSCTPVNTTLWGIQSLQTRLS